MLSTSFTATCPLPSTLLGCHLPAPLHPPLPPRLCSLLCCQSSSTLSAVTLSPRLPSPLSSLISSLCLSPLRHSARHRLDTLNCSMIQLLNRSKQNIMIQLWKLIGLVLDFYRQIQFIYFGLVTLELNRPDAHSSTASSRRAQLLGLCRA